MKKMILQTQQQAHQLFMFSSTYNKSNLTFNHHGQIHFSCTFSRVPFMSLSMGMGKPYKRRNRNRSKCFSSSTTTPAPLPPDPDKEVKKVAEESDDVVVEGGSPDLQTLFRRFWKVAAPYWSSDDKAQARLQLAGVFALTLATTGISVGFNFLGRDFYNALANKDQEQFTKQLLYYLGGFAGGIPFFVLRDYARETLSLRWRSWMTSYYMDRYLKDRTFYKIQSQSIIDNPDQRIVDDLSSFTGTALSFSLTLFNAAVDLISFSNILYGIYPPLFVVLLVYSVGGTAISVFLGRELVTLNFLQEKKEADFRYGLVRVRENAESIAFYGGEDSEMQLLLQRFKSAFENLTRLLISSRNLDFFTSGYRYLIQILPAAVVAPMYFSGKIEFGVINQSVSAFNHILGDFSLIVYQFQAISAFSAVINRLGEFDDILDRSSSKSLSDTLEDIHITYKDFRSSSALESNGSTPSESYETLLEINNLTLKTPSESTLIRDLSVTIKEKDNLLVMGPSGSGKTSLLRALAGLWRTGTGKIVYYVKGGEESERMISSDANTPSINVANDTFEDHGKFASKKSRIFFLPQRPYMVLGTLRQQLLYPIWTDDTVSTSGDTEQKNVLPFLTKFPNSDIIKDKPMKPTTNELIKVLEDVRLGYLLARFSLDSTYEWSSVLSLGEQQRLAFARLLLSRPQLVLLDESTSALDEANEAHLYQLIGAADITYISIGHRSTLRYYHSKILSISTADSDDEQLNWSIGPTRHESSLEFTNQ
ncbi:ABC transporter D family member 2, chloroplastic isoform X1 [Arachis stenosperma]|uniref:ABC transporter D family member 2, chloroplastic isoform X1 n=1 Tax=Arachis stenosperma TaxID=217475 RepID=UPI0025ACC161|nr:ABC transporter D family member 2, chloroplastic isoform X1 [Arachis stenosperma]